MNDVQAISAINALHLYQWSCLALLTEFLLSFQTLLLEAETKSWWECRFGLLVPREWEGTREASSSRWVEALLPRDGATTGQALTHPLAAAAASLALCSAGLAKGSSFCHPHHFVGQATPHLLVHGAGPANGFDRQLIKTQGSSGPSLRTPIYCVHLLSG